MTVHTGDALTVLRTLPEASVQCCVTSPPYWGLRDYGTAGQLGLEKTPAAYVDAMVTVFAEVRRVLRDDGTLWLNLGDSYASGGNGGGGRYMQERAAWKGGTKVAKGFRAAPDGLKDKDLVGIPWLVAFALQGDGWVLRTDIIWSKPNPLPSSVTDRPTRSHEYVFLLSKSGRYFYDQDSTREPHTDPRASKNGKTAARGQASIRPSGKSDSRDRWFHVGGRNARTVWTIATQPSGSQHFAVFPEELAQRCILAGTRVGDTVLDPFCGTGTTGAVADAHQRAFVGIELNPEYTQMARSRIHRDGAPLFSTGAV